MSKYLTAPVVSDFSESLSTGYISTGLPILSKHSAPVHNRIGALLNLEKVARRKKKFFNSSVNKISEGIEYRPEKKRVIKLSIKAIVSPRRFIKTLPKPIAQEGMRVIKRKRV